MAKRGVGNQRLEPKPMAATNFPDKPGDRYAQNWDDPNRQLNASRSNHYWEEVNGEFQYRQKENVINRGNPGIVRRGK